MKLVAKKPDGRGINIISNTTPGIEPVRQSHFIRRSESRDIDKLTKKRLLMKNLIPSDVSRCDSHHCQLAGECSRYLQVNIDEYNENEEMLISSYESYECGQFIQFIQYDSSK